jgi:hypothetical protein
VDVMGVSMEKAIRQVDAFDKKLQDKLPWWKKCVE